MPPHHPSARRSPHRAGVATKGFISFSKEHLLDSSGRWIGDYQYRLLLFLSDLEEVRPRDLVPYFCSNPKSAYAVVRRLEKQGVLERVGHGAYRVNRDAVRNLLRLPVRYIKGGVRRGSAVRSRDGTTPAVAPAPTTAPGSHAVSTSSASSTASVSTPSALGTHTTSAPSASSTASVSSAPVPGGTSVPRSRPGGGATSASAPVRAPSSADLPPFRRPAAGSAPVTTAVGRPGYLGLYLDNVRWYGLDGRWHQLPRSKLLRPGGLDPGWSVGYAEVAHVVGNLVLDGVVVVYTNAEDFSRFGTGAARVEYRPPSGYVRRRGLSSTVLLAREELVKAFKSLAVVLGEILTRRRLLELYSWVGGLWGVV